MAIKKSELYSTLAKCTNKIRSNCGLNAELFKNYVLIMLFLKYISDRKHSGELELIEIPDGCYFEDIVKLKGTTAIGDGINKIIGQIKDANPGVLDFIDQTKHDFCNKDLGKDLKAASNVITELVTAFQADGLDFKRNRAADDDLIGDAYEYLMRNFASQSGKDKGQFYTPTEVSRLMAILIGVNRDTRRNISAYDPTCGSGSLLLRTKAAARPGTSVSLQGQEIDPGNVEMCNLNMIIHGDETADIRWGDTLNNPLHERNGVLDTFDYIVSNPPFSLHRWMSTAKEDDEFGRWNHSTGVPPQQYGDFAFLMHVVKSLKNATQNGPAGHAAVILPNGVLTRGGDEETLRRFLVDQQLISGIVALPPNTFYGTGIAGNIIVIDKNRSRDGILFIDGSRGFYKDEDCKNRLREQDLRRITDAWEARTDIPHFARLASYDDIRAEGYNLNIPRYVAPESKEIDHDIEAHLHGGIPEADIDRLGHVWEAAPSLRAELFIKLRDGYASLIQSPDTIADTIENNAAYMARRVEFGCALDRWAESVRTSMLALEKDCHPKEVIKQWSDSLLRTLLGTESLLNAYEVYDCLMNYWNETMQDDVYMISRDGWAPELTVPQKKNAKWDDLSCDLLPLEIVVETFFSEERDKYNELSERIYAITEQLKTSTDGLDHEDEEGSQYIRLSEKERLMSTATLKKLKANLKKLNIELYDKILLKYSQIDEATVRRLVVNDKWLATIVNRSHEAMDGVAQSLATEIKALHYRYSDTLADIEAEVSEKESAVLNHLKTMGFTL
ncbi:restriction endonuclease subunit M [Barnesiella sp. WM24]|uniref:N-6 DNA methylase n=1 Tax=Barnesiella sp. WM24 TaxID=2558278 RepID=UPI001071EE4A|nr:N-6 DNA methylase [Barnesiella sp. WM24]TFU94383.1 restriction endonuclease subunit M [Barnesiella sp. WM24]